MNIVTTIEAWQKIKNNLQGHTIGFVPTMGNLHAGHLSLCKRSLAENAVTVVSIFVNPTQFNQLQDFDLYPRTLQADEKLLAELAVDYLFLPDAKDIYADQFQVQISEAELSQALEGEYRPGHFTGMLTVVNKLLNIIQPTRAYFGEKDFQQLLLIKKMVAALFMPIEIIACETVRAHDGLALSSRNSRLSEEQRKQAAHFFRVLNSSLSLENMVFELTNLGFKVDYIAEKWQRRLGAVWLGNVRLIDNVG